MFDDPLHHARPPSWVNPPPRNKYDLVIVGGGTAGIAAAREAATLGKSIAIIERHRLGGRRLNYGIALETLAEVARKRAAVHCSASDDRGAQSTALAEALDLARRRRVAFARSIGAWRLTASGVDVHFGEAKFTGRDTIDVNGATLRFERAIVAVGRAIALPTIDGIDTTNVRTLDNFFDFEQPPHRLAVVGGGATGCAIAQIMRTFGSEVHLISAESKLFADHEPFVEQRLGEALASDGIHVMSGAKVLQVGRTGGAKSLLVDVDSQKRKILVDEVLVISEDSQRLNELQLAAAGVEHNVRGVAVTSRLQTTTAAIFAAGEVCDLPTSRQASSAMGTLSARNALASSPQRFDPSIVPRIELTRPQVARVGLLLAEAVRRGIEVETSQLPLYVADRDVAEGVTVHVDASTGLLVGATVVAADAAQRIAPLALALAERLPASRLPIY
jgi:pyruvate/2-oxoglutarate dehydrogenase complex dihydrolipoamide dehydrogenase (E3) component